MRPSLETLDLRMSILERDLDELQTLVDGQGPRTVRSRLHVLENNDRAAELASEALKAYKDMRTSRATRLREWGAFTLAIVALILSAHHGGW